VDARAEAAAAKAGGASPAAAAARDPRHTLVKGGPRASRLSVVADFLLFCKLCVARGAVSNAVCAAGGAEWEWAALLRTAGGMLDRGFNPERCGAQHRYGEAAGGEAMRKLSAIVYDASAEPVEALRGAILAACWGDDQRDAEGFVVHRFSFDAGDEAGIFADVGGVQLWRGLNEQLKATRLEPVAPRCERA
jgi:hypothetical protein